MASGNRVAKEQRKLNRQDFERCCWVQLAPDRVLLASIVDISQAGAKLTLREAVAELPKEFDLLFTRDGKVGRKSELVWHTDNDLGVKFLGRTVPRVAGGALPARVIVKV